MANQTEELLKGGSFLIEELMQKNIYTRRFYR